MPTSVGSMSPPLDVYLGRVHVEFLPPNTHLLLFLRHPAVNGEIQAWWLLLLPSPTRPQGAFLGRVSMPLGTLHAFPAPESGPPGRARTGWGASRGGAASRAHWGGCRRLGNDGSSENMGPRGCFQAYILLYSGTWPLEGSRFIPPRPQFPSL